MLSKRLAHFFIPLLKWSKVDGFWKKSGLVIETAAAIWLYSLFFIYFFILMFYKHVDYNQDVHFYFPSLNEQNISSEQMQKQFLFLGTDPLNTEISGASIFYVDNWIFSWVVFAAAIPEFIHGGYVSAVTIPGSIIFINGDLPIYAPDNYDGYDNLSHELVHILQHQKYGFLASLFITPTWVNEGYPTFRMSLYSTHSIDNLQVTGNFKYYAKLVKHAIEEMGKTPDELHKGNVSYQEVLLSLCQVNNITGCPQ